MAELSMDSTIYTVIEDDASYRARLMAVRDHGPIDLATGGRARRDRREVQGVPGFYAYMRASAEEQRVTEIHPVRLRLSRAKGFSLQALSLATNGLSAVKVSRPGLFGNPWTVAEAAEAFDCRRFSAHEHAVKWFRQWIDAEDEEFEPHHAFDGTKARRDELRRRLPELRGKNLACFCGPDVACHADFLIELSNNTIICESVDAK